MKVLFIHTAYRQSHKLPLNENGLVEYEGQLIEPIDAVNLFIASYSNIFNILRVEVCERIDYPDNQLRPYKWIDIIRYI
jgi:hypothetical protein